MIAFSTRKREESLGSEGIYGLAVAMCTLFSFFNTGTLPPRRRPVTRKTELAHARDFMG